MNFIQSILGQKPTPAPAQGFADFAAAPAPEPVSIPASPADAQRAVPTSPYGSGPVVYTKWYRVWERTTLDDFKLEMYLVPFIILAIVIHFWGTRRNKRKARKWMAVHAPILDSEFALVGYNSVPKMTPDSAGVQNAGLIETSAKLSGDILPDDYLKPKTAYEFETYATGRLNIAFADFKISLWKWYNPLMLLGENLIGVFFDSLRLEPERVEVVLYPFDGNEKNFVAPPVPGAEEIASPKPVPSSTYDNFIFAVVNKMAMRRLRDQRYDLSLTFTKDHAKLPEWATIMSESAEISDAILTKDFVAAIHAAGDLLEYLIITDQPRDKPSTLNEATSKKQIRLCMRLPAHDDYLPSLRLFHAFLRLPDSLVASARFRPEVLKKLNQVRESEKAKLRKVSEAEAAEERTKLADKMRKEERDRKMKGLTADEQRKFLERENAKDRKKQEKKMTRKG